MTASAAAAPRKRSANRLPAQPLLRQIQLRGGDAACGVHQSSAEERALLLARQSGSLTYVQADRLAVHLLGLTLWDLWDLWDLEVVEAERPRREQRRRPRSTATARSSRWAP